VAIKVLRDPLVRHVMREVGTELEKHTGKSGDAWMRQASRLIARHSWRSLGLAVIAAYALGKLRA
jgi:hypothetical protein